MPVVGTFLPVVDIHGLTAFYLIFLPLCSVCFLHAEYPDAHCSPARPLPIAAHSPFSIMHSCLHEIPSRHCLWAHLQVPDIPSLLYIRVSVDSEPDCPQKLNYDNHSFLSWVSLLKIVLLAFS